MYLFHYIAGTGKCHAYIGHFKIGTSQNADEWYKTITRHSPYWLDTNSLWNSNAIKDYSNFIAVDSIRVSYTAWLYKNKINYLHVMCSCWGAGKIDVTFGCSATANTLMLCCLKSNHIVWYSISFVFSGRRKETERWQFSMLCHLLTGFS